MSCARLLWLLILVTACTTFDPITRGVCGNGIVETGEDCDSSDATCIACAITCTTATDCPNTAYSCGADDRCHAPGGTLGQGQVAGAFAANEYHITDIDQDGLGDVVGLSRSSIVIRHGASSGVLDVVESSLTPTQTGPASFGNLDGDASLDVAISTPDGIVAYTSPYGALSPLNVDNLGADTAASGMSAALDVFTITHEAIGGFLNNGGKVVYAIFDFADIGNPVTGSPCNLSISAADFSPSNIEVYQASVDGAATTDVVVALTVGPASAKKLCVLSIHKLNIGTLATVLDITPANAPSYTAKPVFADLSIDADRCPSLVDVDAAPNTLRRYDGAMTPAVGLVPAHCVLKPSATAGGDVLPQLPVSSPQTTIIGRAPIVPGVLGGSSDAIITSDGIYLFTTGPAWQLLYQSARPWSHVAFGDLDKDGATDFVLSGQGADDLDILYRKSFLTFPVFQLFRLDTAAEVTAMSLDDYDGNSYLDIAFTEKLTNHVELDVSYGTSDQPRAPVQVGVFQQLIGFAKIGFPDSADPLDVISDLLVLTPTGLTFLHGSAQRTLLPYFDPRSSNPGTDYSSNTIFRSTVIGNFVSPADVTMDHPDLVGIAVPSKTGSPAGSNPRVWIATGSATTLDSTTSDGAILSGLAACGLGASNMGCVEEATTFAWPLTANHSVVLTIDHSATPIASVFDPSSQVAPSFMATKATSFTPPTKTKIKSVHAADVDGDGALELVAAFEPANANSTSSGVLVCKVDAMGLPSTCVDVVATAILPDDPMAKCIDAGVGHFAYRDRFITPTANADVVVACQNNGLTIYRVSYADGAYTAAVLLHTNTPLDSIQVGDVTGDGVDDIVALEGGSGTQSLVVFTQCTSRNATSCTGESK